MQVIGLLMPIVALYGYYTGNMTLFYWLGGAVAVLDIIALLTGTLRCMGTVLTVLCWFYACGVADSKWEGIILGSCYSSMIVLGVMSVVYIPIILVSITGAIVASFVWLKERLF